MYGWIWMLLGRHLTDWGSVQGWAPLLWQKAEISLADHDACRSAARPAVRVRPFYAPKEGLGSAVNYNSVVVIPARSGPKERAGYLSELGVGRFPEYGSHDS